jgi:hypothetical protein
MILYSSVNGQLVSSWYLGRFKWRQANVSDGLRSCRSSKVQEGSVHVSLFSTNVAAEYQFEVLVQSKLDEALDRVADQSRQPSSGEPCRSAESFISASLSVRIFTCLR